MCGRYSFVPSKKQLDEQLAEFDLPSTLQFSFNISPTHMAYVIPNNHPKQFQQMHWGLVPYWSKDGINSGKLINARSETILEKPSFRLPAARRHCLVPADSFYEWRTMPGKRKVPYRIRLKNNQLLFMAGIWDEWRGGEGSKFTFSIITTTPNVEVAPLHNRMPVLFLDTNDQKRWLETQDPEETQALLHPPKNEVLELYRVSERLNAPGAEGADLHEKIEENEEPTLFT